MIGASATTGRGLAERENEGRGEPRRRNGGRFDPRITRSSQEMTDAIEQRDRRFHAVPAAA
jgi:hypothetical protein